MLCVEAFAVSLLLFMTEKLLLDWSDGSAPDILEFHMHLYVQKHSGTGTAAVCCLLGV